MIIFKEHYPWHVFSSDQGKVYATRSLDDDLCRNLLKKLNQLSTQNDIELINKWLGNAKNHFGVMCEFKSGVFAAADRTGSFPLFFRKNGKNLKIGNYAPALVSGEELSELDTDALLSLEMAGYVTGKRTAVKMLYPLEAGEAILKRRGEIRRWTYHKYIPQMIDTPQSKKSLTAELAETTLYILERIKDEAGDRQVLIPLSAGLDSRLIASGLKYLGAKNLVCFSYGLPNNFEASTASQIAEKLDIDWHFVPLSSKKQKLFFQTSTYQNYLDFTHNFRSSAFQQDLYPVKELMKLGIADTQSIIINGNSGDFISGGHIPNFLQANHEITKTQSEMFISHFLNKHFALWENRFSAEQYTLLADMLMSDIEQDGLCFTKTPTYAIWERLEFINRQSKYVISGQRVYDFLGLDWELPLWQDAYLDFWSKVPLSLKANQNLYKDMLHQQNWCGVWKNIPVNHKKISPSWIIPFRLMAKAACASFGRDTWHRIEKRFFAYWMDWGGNYAITPYWKLATSSQIARNSVSVHSDAYIERIRNELKESSV